MNILLENYIRRFLLTERRDKSWYKVISDVYSGLPYFVLQDLYSQEKHGESLKYLIEVDLDSEDPSFDKLRNKVEELWGERKSGKEILGYLLSGMKDENYKKGVDLIKSWESGETHYSGDKTQWWNVKWSSKKPKIINLNWERLNPKKVFSWKRKYLSKDSNFPMLGVGGSFTKTLRMINSLSLEGKHEPVIFVFVDGFVDIIGGNNRTFNLFFKKYCEVVNLKLEDLKKVKNEDECREIYKKFFDYLENNEFKVKVNCYIGSKD